MRFRAAVFTNLSRDHLDYHETPRAYFEAKAKLFRQLDPDSFAVLNDRDPMSKELALLTRGRVLRYGGHARCDVRIPSCVDAIQSGFRPPPALDAALR